MNELENKIMIDTLIERNESIPTVDLGDEIGMLSIETGRYFGLDSIGTHIWQIIEKPKLVKDIVSLLVLEYDVDENNCSTDVISFLIDLYSQNLIRIRNKE